VVAVAMSVLGGIEWLGRLAQTHPGAVVLAFGLVMLLGLILRATIGRAPRQVPTTHGSARWATRRECRRAGLFGRAGIVLGHAWGHYLRFDGEEHVALIGPTRSWKGRAHLIPTLLTRDRVPWSVLVTDPKDGENAAVTARWRAQFGPVWRFTPRSAAHEKINVLDTIRLKTRMEFGDAHLIAQSLVAPEKWSREHPTSLHFRELAALLLTAVILHVLYTGRRTSLAGVWAFMTQEHTSLPACLKAMSQTRHTSAGVHQAIVSMTRAVQNITGDRELSSVWSTAIRPLVLYNDDLVAESTDISTVNLDDLQYGPTPVSLYLIAPSPMELDRLHPVYRVVLEVAMTRLMSHPVRRWSHRLRLIGDEFPSYGYMRVMEKGVSVMAGYGMQALLVMQDLEQLWEVYGEHTQIWGNCKVKLFHAPDNDLTAKRISENLLGEQTVENPVAQQTPVLGQRRSISLQHTGRPLLTPDELMNLPEDQLIVRVRGIPPVRATKCDYRTDPAFAGRWEEVA
jgi:type IV secretion system protein VirD4